MSVVAGCTLLDGVLLAADCRVTYRRPGRPDIHVDSAQKLFPVAPGTAVRFVGDVAAASRLLTAMLDNLRCRRHQDPCSLADWIPRLFRREYARLAPASQGPDLKFMFAALVKGRQTIVERRAVFEIFRRASVEKNRRWFPGIVGEILKAGTDYVGIPGTSVGLLYLLRAPRFTLDGVPPLQFAVMGSGAPGNEITYFHDMIVLAEPGNLLMESMNLREAIADFYLRRNEPTIGGLYPVLKLVGKQIQYVGFETEIPHRGTKIVLIHDGQRWLQRNTSTGKEMPLLPPWQLPKAPDADCQFDDLHQAYAAFLRG